MKSEKSLRVDSFVVLTMEHTAAKSVPPMRMHRPTFVRVGSFSPQNAAMGTIPRTMSVKAVKAGMVCKLIDHGGLCCVVKTYTRQSTSTSRLFRSESTWPGSWGSIDVLKECTGQIEGCMIWWR